MDMCTKVTVLIESDWNLKKYDWSHTAQLGAVLIESDWNLKFYKLCESESSARVLIESDWNLKYGHGEKSVMMASEY